MFIKLDIIDLVRKGSKARLYRLKTQSNGNVGVASKWTMDEIKSLELGSIECQIIIVMQKPSTWYFENLQKRVEFIHSILAVSQKTLKKIPRLLNFDEEMIEGLFT